MIIENIATPRGEWFNKFEKLLDTAKSVGVSRDEIIYTLKTRGYKGIRKYKKKHQKGD
jgi:hypothetical protein